MTIRQSLLAILAEGPCYGNQLRSEFERRTGGTWPLNAGQVYSTLDRLERDLLVVKGDPDDAGLVVYTITVAGRSEAVDWLATPVDRAATARDELAVKLALALTLPGADAPSLIAAQRPVTTAQRRAAESAQADSPAHRLILDAQAFAADAELRWLEHCESLVATAEPFGLSVDPPRRGRPITTRL